MGRLLGRNQTVKEPETEVLDFLKDGSSTPVRIVSKKPFVRINLMNINIKWTNVNSKFSFTDFANGSALTNGVGLEYNGRPKFPHLVSDNHDWHIYAGTDEEVEIDTKTSGMTNAISLTAMISFFRWGEDGFDMRNSELALIINDDLPDSAFSIIEANVSFLGWVWGDRDQRKIK